MTQPIPPDSTSSPAAAPRRAWSRRTFIGVGATAIAGGVLAWDAFGVEATRVLVTRHEVRVPDLPPVLDGLVVAQITDTHLPANATAVRHAHDLIRDLKPDLVLYTGDLAEHRGGLDAVRELMQGARGSAGTFAMLGNWEHTYGITPTIAETAYGPAGCELLLNRLQQVRVRGVDVEVRAFDDYVQGRPALGLAEVAGTASLRIWASHAPALARDLPPGRTPPHLFLAGHTHGGQIRIPGVAPWLPIGSGGFVAGWYDLPDFPLYVSRGVGTTTIRARFRCPAELPVFTFRRA